MQSSWILSITKLLSFCTAHSTFLYNSHLLSIHFVLILSLLSLLSVLNNPFQLHSTFMLLTYQFSFSHNKIGKNILHYWYYFYLSIFVCFISNPLPLFSSFPRHNCLSCNIEIYRDISLFFSNVHSLQQPIWSYYFSASICISLHFFIFVSLSVCVRILHLLFSTHV